MDVIKSVNPHYGEGKEYSTNCALCTTAALLGMRGYDVEAMPIDKTWRGPVDVFDFDYKNHDNYISPGNSSMNITGMDWWESRNNPNKFSTSLKKNTKIIDDKMKDWGTHSVAELAVGWKNGKYHSVVVYREKYRTTVMDFQTHSFYDLDNYINKVKKDRLKPTFMELKRMDNASIKQNIPDLDKMVKKKER